MRNDNYRILLTKKAVEYRLKQYPDRDADEVTNEELEKLSANMNVPIDTLSHWLNDEAVTYNKYFSVNAVASEFNVSVWSVYKWIRQGLLQAVRQDKRWRIPENAIKEFKKTYPI